MISTEEKMLKERIQHLLSFKKVSVASISDSESERVMLGRQIKGENTVVSFRTIHKLLDMFHDIDANWLILGEGQMKKNTDAPHIHNTTNEVNGSSAGGSIYVGASTIPYPVQALLDEKDKRIAELEENNKTLRLVLDAITTTTQVQKKPAK